jgi:hypothetical protein
MFFNIDGKPLSPQGIYYLVKSYGAKAGITKRVYPHLFRTTSATILLRRGVSLYDIQEQLGHTNLDTTRKYLRPFRASTHKSIVNGFKQPEPTPQPQQPETQEQPKQESKPDKEPQEKPKPKSEPTDSYIAKPSDKEILMNLYKQGAITLQELSDLLKGKSQPTHKQPDYIQ